MSPKLILYEIAPSPPVRAVKMLAEALNLELELKTVNLLNREHQREEYVKINPNHTVPTLDDNGFILWDSHAILMYLMDKYAKTDSFYPHDLNKRSQVNQLLFCDASIFAKLVDMFKPMYYGEKTIPIEKTVSIEDSYKSINAILEGKSFLTGDEVTIADMSLVATITSLELGVPIEEKIFPNISAWIKRMEILPFYEPNRNGIQEHIRLLKKLQSR